MIEMVDKSRRPNGVTGTGTGGPRAPLMLSLSMWLTERTIAKKKKIKCAHFSVRVGAVRGMMKWSTKNDLGWSLLASLLVLFWVDSLDFGFGFRFRKNTRISS
jgi:hypothetical protein